MYLSVIWCILTVLLYRYSAFTSRQCAQKRRTSCTKMHGKLHRDFALDSCSHLMVYGKDRPRHLISGRNSHLISGRNKMARTQRARTLNKKCAKPWLQSFHSLLYYYCVTTSREQQVYIPTALAHKQAASLGSIYRCIASLGPANAGHCCWRTTHPKLFVVRKSKLRNKMVASILVIVHSSQFKYNRQYS